MKPWQSSQGDSVAAFRDLRFSFHALDDFVSLKTRHVRQSAVHQATRKSVLTGSIHFRRLCRVPRSNNKRHFTIFASWKGGEITTISTSVFTNVIRPRRSLSSCDCCASRLLSPISFEIIRNGIVQAKFFLLLNEYRKNSTDKSSEFDFLDSQYRNVISNNHKF